MEEQGGDLVVEGILLSKPGNTSSNPRSHIKMEESTDSTKLSFDVYICTHVHHAHIDTTNRANDTSNKN